MKRLLALTVFVALAQPAGAQINVVSGRVAMADGGQLPDRVAIQRDCGGASQTDAYTDRSGQFNFRWGQATGLMPDASTAGSRGGFPGSAGDPEFTRATTLPSLAPGANVCELRAVVPGYRSDTVRLDERTSDVGIIFLHRIDNGSGSSVSATSLKVPGEAKKAFDRGLEALGKGKSADAEKDFEKAVGIYPQYAEAWLTLGKLRLQRKADDSAAEALQKAADADQKMVEAFVYLGMIDVGKKQWADAAKNLDTAVQLDPVRFPDAWFNDAVAGYNLKNYDAAEKSVREAMKLDPQRKNPQCDYLLGLILAAKKDYRGAAEQLRAYIKYSPDAPDVDKAKTQLAEIEKLQTQ